ncbi:haloacid dehalogenase-like hydrolase [Salmonella enterica subsp. enterica]|uniref:Haloacid dehalogenase-like hydrolase n=1 Tax=Salmonella enterica I TaxID=59201 RepID=A0A447N0Q3_SALET|nr:haloacid dehalogenase-like hydrolase [Salmonella enterica subsp. enterica]
MLYIFDLGNVIVDIDFNRVLGVWSDLSRVPAGFAEAKIYDGARLFTNMNAVR